MQPEPVAIAHGQLAAGALQRLAESIRFPTITWTDQPFDTAVFEDFLAG